MVIFCFDLAKNGTNLYHILYKNIAVGIMPTAFYNRKQISNIYYSIVKINVLPERRLFMAYDVRKNRIVNYSQKDLDNLRKFAERYHPELPILRISLDPADVEYIEDWYGNIARLYLREVVGLPI